MHLYKYSLAFGFAACLLLVFSACEDVVDLELEDAPVRLVVDGWINNNPEPQTIRLTNSAPYFDSTPTPGVSGATITVLSSSGKTMNFVDNNNGDYVWTPQGLDSIGIVGESFELNITLDGKTYRSESQLNRVPKIDSIGQEFTEETNFAEDRIECNFFARDPQGTGDTYWIKTFKNGVFQAQPSEINIAYDAGFSPGSEVDGFIFIPPIRDAMNPEPEMVEAGEKVPSPWAVGDQVRVEIHSISNEAYFFLDIVQTQLLNSSNGIFAEPLSNTTGNVVQENGDDEVLGMFVVSAISSFDYEIE